MKILGIDPGTGRMGYGVIDGKNCVTYGCLETNKNLTAGERLYILEKGLLGLLKDYSPEIVAVETLFFFKNNKTAMAVAEARGVVLLVAAKKKLPVREFSPLQMKMMVAGYGRAEKKQVQHMVAKLLSLAQIPKPDDAADALGIALCCQKSLSTRYPQ
jgi:crossover junction endodeoxyribonuclease RuvC